MIVIDQFRYDYLQRFSKHFVDGGFKRFMREGATFGDVRYRHYTTDTCPGHAVIATGTWGNLNGIVANAWYDAELGKKVECGDSAGRSEADQHLLQPTVGDTLKKASDGGSKVFVASGKRSAATILGGQSADLVFWTDGHGRFVTSADKRRRVPRWIKKFNDTQRVEAYFGNTWNRILPVEEYAPLGRDDEPAERDAHGLGRTFPHPMTGGGSKIGPDFYQAFLDSPYLDEVLLEFVAAAIREEKLGQGESTDLMAISFSANDKIGHAYGPDSHEALDIVVRTDRLLATLFQILEQNVGLNHALIVLTADHGLAPLPEVAQVRSWRKAGRVSETALVDAATAALDGAYGQPETGNWVVFHDYPNIYLNEAILVAKGGSIADGERLVSTALEAVPGVEAAYTRTELKALQNATMESKLSRAALLSLHAERSGHVVYRVMPFHVARDSGANHGSPWEYDTHVPLMWYGVGVKPGSYHMTASPADIVPTLMTLLGHRGLTASQGRVLDEMLIPATVASR